MLAQISDSKAARILSAFSFGILEQFKEQNLLTKEKVVDYLTNSVLKKPKQMIQTLVRKL